MAASPEAPISPSRLAELNDQFESASPEQILGWAVTEFPEDIILTCSFQHDGVVLAHMLRTIKPDIPVVFIETRFHFAETLKYRDNIVKLLGLNLRQLEAEMSADEFRAKHSDNLYDRDPDLCCQINKVEPLRKALAGTSAWINGRRRNQTEERAAMGHVELAGSVVKINPLARWTSKDTYKYLNCHRLPEHPLFERGYASIGCAPCTSLGEARSGRWAGSNKRECGIHTVMDAGGPNSPEVAELATNDSASSEDS
ncbi:MAG TPA: phosphoadenylyl-sulfate reductase [Deltaproteobacteria bacterium]|nr:phosphoadenylyl-sulfate reductase [Candidatus Binatota bacterium]HIL13437.1 phosphoadenylyl-sulfate reductase [Deltaproteobacteria bacterium]